MRQMVVSVMPGKGQALSAGYSYYFPKEVPKYIISNTYRVRDGILNFENTPSQFKKIPLSEMGNLFCLADMGIWGTALQRLSFCHYSQGQRMTFQGTLFQHHPFECRVQQGGGGSLSGCFCSVVKL